jgi:hypothetical protein
MSSTFASYPFEGGGGGGGGVTSLNTLTGSVTLAAGSGISITPSGNTLTISDTNGGTVTSVSVASANGLAGTSSGGATPVLTLSTSITGILQGNGTAISAATTTGTGSVVLATSPTLVTPALGTPSALVLTNATGLPTTALTGTLQAAQVPAFTGDITTTAGSLTTTLATVNSNVGSFTYSSITVNAKGLITAASSGAAPTGTVTSISVVSANGLAGTVATATTTPAITLSTSITGILQGNGTAISAATTTGSGNVVLATSPTLVTPALGTPASGVATNLTGTAAGLTSGIATNIGGGLGGSVPYQTAVNTTALLANGSSGQVLTSGGGTNAPSWVTPGSPTVLAKTAAYTTIATDGYVDFDMSGSSNANYAVTLLTAVGNTGLTTILTITKGTGILSINTTSSQTIGGISSGVIKMATVNDSITVYSDGANWQIRDMNITVGIRYHGATATITGTDSIVTFTTKDFDPLSLYSSGTFTATIPGKYQINTNMQINATYSAGVASRLGIYSGGSIVSQQSNGAEAAATSLQLNVSDIYQLAAGGTLVVEASSDGSTPTISGTTARNTLSIMRIGN